ncbi:hypothetical protein BGW80DRAFT_670950 [Lactifluus volemus]|nr:hypothetical protein BGW80DRAFT_670950 [Lactifluus volemus]
MFLFFERTTCTSGDNWTVLQSTGDDAATFSSLWRSPQIVPRQMDFPLSWRQRSYSWAQFGIEAGNAVAQEASCAVPRNPLPPPPPDSEIPARVRCGLALSNFGPWSHLLPSECFRLLRATVATSVSMLILVRFLQMSMCATIKHLDHPCVPSVDQKQKKKKTIGG